MQPDRARESQRWFDQAVHDLDDARYNRDGGRCHLAGLPYSAADP
jgi:hypothetical protein